MSEHYYTPNPAVAHQRHEVELAIHDVHLKLVTDSGVFSRNEIDPGTRILLENVEPPQSGSILDMGCGYGPIGLYYAACCPDCEVHMTDVNERASALSQENARRNRLSNVVVHSGEAFAPVAGMTFSLIVSNPPIRAGKQTLLEIFRGAKEHLASGGRFAFVARTQQGAKTLARELQEIFGNVEDVARGGGYRVYAAVCNPNQ